MQDRNRGYSRPHTMQRSYGRQNLRGTGHHHTRTGIHRGGHNQNPVRGTGYRGGPPSHGGRTVVGQEGHRHPWGGYHQGDSGGYQKRSRGYGRTSGSGSRSRGSASGKSPERTLTIHSHLDDGKPGLIKEIGIATAVVIFLWILWAVTENYIVCQICLIVPLVYIPFIIYSLNYYARDRTLIVDPVGVRVRFPHTQEFDVPWSLMTLMYNVSTKYGPYLKFVKRQTESDEMIAFGLTGTTLAYVESRRRIKRINFKEDEFEAAQTLIREYLKYHQIPEYTREEE